jgi:hypothetical protein
LYARFPFNRCVPEYDLAAPERAITRSITPAATAATHA